MTEPNPLDPEQEDEDEFVEIEQEPKAPEEPISQTTPEEMQDFEKSLAIGEEVEDEVAMATKELSELSEPITFRESIEFEDAVKGISIKSSTESMMDLMGHLLWFREEFMANNTKRTPKGVG